MCRNFEPGRQPLGRRSRGFTLVEVLLAMTITTILAAALAAMASAVQQGGQHNQAHDLATQHARVTLERIARTVGEATATEDYPGVVVVYKQVGAWRFPDTLVVWHPAGAAANPDGPPLANELVIYCPDPDSPGHLVEITAGSDTSPVELNETLNTGAGRAQIEAIKTSSASRKVLLTDLMKTAVPSNGGDLRGAVRFEYELHPTQAQWNAYQNNNVDWEDIAWPQGIYGAQTGLRQVWLRTELQLLPKTASADAELENAMAIPFLGSATFYYDMNR